MTTDTAQSSATSQPAASFDLDRSLEAILMVADEPQSLMHLATAVSRPVA